jgi:hypothetical protein
MSSERCSAEMHDLPEFGCRFGPLWQYFFSSAAAAQCKAFGNRVPL